MTKTTLIDTDVVEQMRDAFAGATRILVTSHIRPDGDAVGSLLGLGLALKAAGKDVQMVLVDGVPSTHRFLKGADQILKQASGEFDLRVSIDTADLDRLGGAHQNHPVDLVIDHHITNLRYGRLNLIDPGAPATAVILTRYLPRWNLPLTVEVASALMTGLITDTIGFRTSNMTPEAFRAAAQLMELGADLHEIYQRTLISRSYRAARYWGAGLSKLQRMDRLIWTTLTLEDRKTMGYNGNDDADLTNLLSSIEEADISVLFIEQRDQLTKVSWRARPGLDVSQIALQFGGGGHPAAAGAEVPGSMDLVVEKVLKATKELLKSRNE